METMYSSSPDGLCGNDDAGQMSAWYIFSALGFYPVSPGSEYYAIGSPLVMAATISLDNGRVFEIITRDQSPSNVYIQKVVLNGRELDRNYLIHDDILNGGRLTFFMGAIPNKDWGK
jgi:putative alpha-1,2-mannosidase